MPTFLLTKFGAEAKVCDHHRKAIKADVDLTGFMPASIPGWIRVMACVSVSGKDLLDGGADDDLMRVGHGVDTFVFKGGNDMIQDFDAGFDRWFFSRPPD